MIWDKDEIVPFNRGGLRKNLGVLISCNTRTKADPKSAIRIAMTRQVLDKSGLKYGDRVVVRVNRQDRLLGFERTNAPTGYKLRTNSSRESNSAGASFAISPTSFPTDVLMTLRDLAGMEGMTFEKPQCSPSLVVVNLSDAVPAK